MFKAKFIAGILLVVAVLFAQVGTAFAAPSQETTTITGTVVALAKETDFNGVTTILVTVQDDTGAQQTYRISVDTAVSLGLATVDLLTNEVTLLDLTQGVPPIVTIDPTTVIADEEPFNPVAAILASFFGVSTTTINQYHEAGFGFGVIAQALWMSRDSEGITDSVLAGDILRVKQSKDYETFFLNHPEYAEQFGDNMPTNWGQFKKLLSEKKNNLGTVVSQENGNSSDHSNQEKHNNKNNGNGQGNDHGNPNRP
jgi:hypothetical protein